MTTKFIAKVKKTILIALVSGDAQVDIVLRGRLNKGSYAKLIEMFDPEGEVGVVITDGEGIGKTGQQSG